MKLGITDAAEATGKSRSTLYRYIDSGKLSAGKDREGNTVIDVSELQRVFETIQLPGQPGTPSEPQMKQPNTLYSRLETQLLESKVTALEHERDLERERRQRAEGEVDRLLEIVETQTRQLVGPVQDEPTVTLGFWSRLFKRS